MTHAGPTATSRGAFSRAQLFLSEAKSCIASDRVRFEAFLDASIVFGRAAIHRMRDRLKRAGKGTTWWDSILEDEAVRFFRTHRDVILHERPLAVGQKIFVGSIESEEPTDAPQIADEFYFFDDPSESATATVARRLMRLQELLSEAERELSEGSGAD
jgi:hypothetical protein